jgi:hypothetical protein
MKRTTLEDNGIGKVILFADWWRNKKAHCLLVGTGSGPEGESVRIVGNPIRNGGFTVSYVRSYDEGNGNARRAYEFLARHFGYPIKVVEVVSEKGIGFHRHLMEESVISSMKVELEGYDPQTDERLTAHRTPPAPKF